MCDCAILFFSDVPMFFFLHFCNFVIYLFSLWLRQDDLKTMATVRVFVLFVTVALCHAEALADCASIIFGINGAKKHNFLNEHCHGIISKF